MGDGNSNDRTLLGCVATAVQAESSQPGSRLSYFKSCTQDKVSDYEDIWERSPAPADTHTAEVGTQHWQQIAGRNKPYWIQLPAQKASSLLACVATLDSMFLTSC